MTLSLLSINFVEILKNEWPGLIASVFILVSFLTTDQIKTRMINSIGCAVFIVYGFLLPAYSTALMNAAMLIVHAVFLIKHMIKKRKDKKPDNVPEKTAEQRQIRSRSEYSDPSPDNNTEHEETDA